MNLLQILLDIQLFTMFQSLSVANAARFSRGKDTQFPLHRLVFSSKKYQPSLQPTSLRRAWYPEDSQHVSNGIKHSVHSSSVISSGCAHPFLSYTQSSPARRLQVPSVEFRWDLLLFSSVSFRADGSWRGWLEGGTTLGNFHAHLDYYIL